MRHSSCLHLSFRDSDSSACFSGHLCVLCVHSAIWRAAKVHKRLRRLVELCGIKCLTLPQYDWDAKRQAFAYLGAVLKDFATNRLSAAAAVSASSNENNGSDGNEKTAHVSSPKRRRKTDNSSVAGSDVPRNVMDHRGQAAGRFGHRSDNHASAASYDSSSSMVGPNMLDRAEPSAAGSLCVAVGVCEAAKFEEALILPLRHSALKAFSVSAVSTVPAGSDDSTSSSQYIPALCVCVCVCVCVSYVSIP